ncbi:SPOR domain-containing protein [Phytohalomonas tamaricis]|uniref:SPOR domain-containing protein n=1 Tax=Phytohalomonas tamaricis TaxID=2081032 RepID=UPI000D0BB703|nr:SPOR domain-containing protein [Phytohalomonas tamaricis]
MARRPANSSQRPAKKGATNKRSSSRNSSGGFHVPGWLWAIIGIIAGFALAQYLREEPTQPDQVAAVVAKPSRNTVSSQPSGNDNGQDGQKNAEGSAQQQQSAAPEAQMPTFEFYTLLPESEVIAPTVDAYHSTPRPGTEAAIAAQNAKAVAQHSNTAPAKSTTKAPAAEQKSSPPQADTSGGKLPSYVLQAASFKASGDASKLAGKLKDLGMLAKVTEVKTADGSTWYRVQVGPYQDTRELSRARDLMETQGIEPLLIRQKG